MSGVIVPAETKVAVQGRSSGMPCVVPAFKDGEEFGCVSCYQRFPDASGIVAHVAQFHHSLLFAGNKII